MALTNHDKAVVIFKLIDYVRHPLRPAPHARPIRRHLTLLHHEHQPAGNTCCRCCAIQKEIIHILVNNIFIKIKSGYPFKIININFRFKFS